MKQLLLLCVLFCLPVLAATAPEIASYALPADAVKHGPLPHRQSDETFYAFFLPEAEIKRSNVIGDQTFYGDLLVGSTLFKNGKKHGIAREWYHNGQPKREIPYNLGLMDGTVKHWNEQGQLVGQYEMSQGAGTRRIYYDNGVIKEEEELKDNKRDGRVLDLFPNGQVSFLGYFKQEDTSGYFKKEDTYGAVFSFYENGLVDHIVWSRGPYIYFERDGAIQKKRWTLKGWEFEDSDVSEEEYAKAAALDKSLPPYFADAQRYKQFVTPEVKALVEKYRALPHVKIPLEFDDKGETVLAPPVEP